jgi:hypothetical protein
MSRKFPLITRRKLISMPVAIPVVLEEATAKRLLASPSRTQGFRLVELDRSFVLFSEPAQHDA